MAKDLKVIETTDFHYLLKTIKSHCRLKTNKHYEMSF